MHKNSPLLILLIISFQFFLYSCRNKIIYDGQLIVKEQGWNRNDTFEDQIVINDTINSFNIFITLDINNNYPFSNLYLFVTTVLPDNNVLRDTINCHLADERGKWLGKSRFGKTLNTFPYKTNIRFPDTGTYNFKIEQAMRAEPLKGVLSCGIKIETYLL